MAKKPSPTPSEGVPAAMTLDEIDAQLELLASERLSLLDSEAAIPANEQRLHERNAPDTEFTALDVRRRRLRHALDQIEDREAALLRRVPEAKRGERQRVWLALVNRFETLASQAARHASELQAVQHAIHELHVEGCRLGFNTYESWSTLPTIADVRIDYAAFMSLPGHVAYLRRAVVDPIVQAEAWPVKFRAFTIVSVNLAATGYNFGEVASFAAELGWSLVERERASWADPRRVPPKPAPKRKRAR